VQHFGIIIYIQIASVVRIAKSIGALTYKNTYYIMLLVDAD